jgi:hypothetical protein
VAENEHRALEKRLASQQRLSKDAEAALEFERGRLLTMVAGMTEERDKALTERDTLAATLEAAKEAAAVQLRQHAVCAAEVVSVRTETSATLAAVEKANDAAVAALEKQHAVQLTALNTRIAELGKAVVGATAATAALRVRHAAVREQHEAALHAGKEEVTALAAALRKVELDARDAAAAQGALELSLREQLAMMNRTLGEHAAEHADALDAANDALDAANAREAEAQQTATRCEKNLAQISTALQIVITSAVLVTAYILKKKYYGQELDIDQGPDLDENADDEDLDFWSMNSCDNSDEDSDMTCDRTDENYAGYAALDQHDYYDSDDD